METLESLDAQIAMLHEQLAQLKRRRNRLAPICRLPFELLIHILKLIQRPVDAFRVDYMTYSWEPFDNSWINVAAICAFMREKVMDAVDIWAVVDVHSADNKWLEYCKQRAGDVPLTIRAVRRRTGYGASDSVHIFASKNLSRARAVYLRPEGVGLRVIQAALHRRNPSLRALDYDGFGEFKWTPKLLGGSCDLLQKLVLNRVDIEGTVPLPGLRHLSLVDFRFNEASLVPLYDMLTKAPNLEILCLNPSDLSTHPTEFPQNQLVAMPLLRKLELNTVTARLAQLFLQTLATPTEQLKLGVEMGSKAALDALLQSIAPPTVRFTTTLKTGRSPGSYWSNVIANITHVPNGTPGPSIFVTASSKVEDIATRWHNTYILSLTDDRGWNDIVFLKSALLLPDLRHMLVQNKVDKEKCEQIEAWLRRNQAVAAELPHISFSRTCEVDVEHLGADLKQKGLVKSFDVVM
jgi:hypothetical protein